MKTAILSILFNFTLLYAAEPNPIADFHARLEKALAPTESFHLWIGNSSYEPYFEISTQIGDDYESCPAVTDSRFDVFLTIDSQPFLEEFSQLLPTTSWNLEETPDLSQIIGYFRNLYEAQFLIHHGRQSYPLALKALEQMDLLNQILWEQPVDELVCQLMRISVHKNTQELFYLLAAEDTQYSDDFTKKLLNHKILRKQPKLAESVRNNLFQQNAMYQNNLPAVINKFRNFWEGMLKKVTENYESLKSENFAEGELEDHQWSVEFTENMIKTISKTVQLFEQLTPADCEHSKDYLQAFVESHLRTLFYPQPPAYPSGFSVETNPLDQETDTLVAVHDSLNRILCKVENLRQLAKSAILLKIQPDDTAHLQNLINAFDGKPMTLDLDRMVVKIKQLPKLKHYTKGEPIKRERWDYFPLKLKLKTPTE